MGFEQLRQEEIARLDALVDDGELTEEEAVRQYEDWEAGYGDYMYDILRDRQMFGDDY